MKKLIFKIFVVITAIIPIGYCLAGCSFYIGDPPTSNVSISDDGYLVVNNQKTDIKAYNSDEEKNYSIKDAYDELIKDGYTGTFSDFIKEYFSENINLSAEISKTCKSSVVMIERTNNSKTGSGIIIKKDDNGNAFILTNYHVTYPNASVENFKIYLADDDLKQNKIAATFMCGDETADLAILKVENSEIIKSASVAILANTDVKEGEMCIAIGNTHSKGISITIGNISKINDKCSYSAGALGSKTRTVLRHCAYIEKGSSGGGLFNLAGELIGITNAGESGDTTLMNYALPIETIKEFLNENFYNL